MTATRLNKQPVIQSKTSDGANAADYIKHTIAMPSVSGYYPAAIVEINNPHPAAFAIASFYMDGTDAVVWKRRVASHTSGTWVTVSVQYLPV